MSGIWWQKLLLRPTLEILIQRLAADAERAGERRFLLACFCPSPQIGHLFRRQGFLAATVRTTLFGQRDAFPLALMNQCPFKLGECTHDGKQELAKP